MKYYQALNSRKKLVQWKVINLRKNQILIISFIVIAVTFALARLSQEKEVSNIQNQAFNQVLNVCDNPKQKATDDDTYMDDDSSYQKSNCSFSSYEPITISELDKISCVRISKYLIKDKNYVYKQQYDPGSSDYSSYIILKEATPRTFRSLKYGYYTDDNHVFYDAGESYKIVKNVDILSIHVLSTHYLKDKNNIYFSQLYRQEEIKPLTGFDIDTFVVVQNNSNHEQYFKDLNGVYYNERLGVFSPDTSKVNDADSDSFVVMPQYLLAKDKKNVYYKGEIVPHLNALTFEVLDGGYYRDSYSIYTGNFAPLQNSDPCSFELVGYKGKYEWSEYAKDTNQVYYRDSIVEGADPLTFQAKILKDGIYGGFDKNYQYQGKFRVKK